MEMPKDPMLLLSLVNTKLRDFYPTLDDLCQSEGLDKKGLEEKLGTIDYVYDPETNRFV